MGAILGGTNKKGAGFGWWWHTPDDTLDKMDPDLLVRDTRVYVHAIWRLLTDAVLPLDYGAQAATLAGDIEALRAELGDRLDLQPLLRRTQTLGKQAAACKAKGAKADGAEAERLNRALMAVSRALVPIDYTTGDRFNHDPALGQTRYPALDAVRRLAKAPAGSDAAKFAIIDARRAVNRIAFALDEASAALQACP
jgi:hypothetical protein